VIVAGNRSDESRALNWSLWLHAYGCTCSIR
jgi:hypothetical protein